MAARRTGLFLSPHFDDVAFSCGGLAAMLAERGWRVVLATVFTRSIHPATGFALACQRDKHLPDEVDYLALRCEEDRQACAALGCEQRLLDLPEAPNRGYESAAALFAAPRPEDDIVPELGRRLSALLVETEPALVLAPQGCGSHVDHLRLIEALLPPRPASPIAFYRDTPYVIREPSAPADRRVAAAAAADLVIPLSDRALAAKLQAVAAYASQLDFQFGSEHRACLAIQSLARRDGGERVLCADAEELKALLSP